MRPMAKIEATFELEVYVTTVRIGFVFWPFGAWGLEKWSTREQGRWTDGFKRLGIDRHWDAGYWFWTVILGPLQLSLHREIDSVPREPAMETAGRESRG